MQGKRGERVEDGSEDAVVNSDQLVGGVVGGSVLRLQHFVQLREHAEVVLLQAARDTQWAWSCALILRAMA